MKTSERPDYWTTWVWTPYHVEQQERQERSGLILPEGTRFLPQPEREVTPAITHFSRLSETGEEISWLWLFQDAREPIYLRLLPERLPDSDPVGSLIEATLPPRNPNEPPRLRLATVPHKWLVTLDLTPVQEIWVGFDIQTFLHYRSLERAATRYGRDEFLKHITTTIL